MYKRNWAYRGCIKKKVALPVFENNLDVPKAGVLLCVPALLSNGLLSHNNVFDFDPGYYSLSSIFLTLSFCSLLRIKSIEKISDEPPGELGKLIGLDRIPEIKTLRNKIAELGQQDQGKLWIGELSREWMQMYPDLAGVMYIDGHTDVYYGKANKLPRHYVSRMRLAMRASADYWVCDKLGQPFFSINKSISGSMIDVIKQDIIPVLENDIPNQPNQAALNNDPHLHKFMIVYDREGYSPDFMIDMWEKRVACCTYNKYTQDPWPKTEFAQYEIETPNGEKELVQLAERAVLLEGNETESLPVAMQVVEVEQTGQGIQVKTTNKRTKKKRQIWVREIRKLRNDGNQTSIITTNYKLDIVLIGMYMFARWCQENFFKYMVHNFSLDMIISNFLTDINDTEQMVNPVYRELEKKIRALNAKLKHRQSKLGALHYDNEINSKEFNGLTEKKSKLQEDVAIYRCQLEEHKAMRQNTPPKINYADLPEEEKFKGVYNQRKQVVDTIKLIASRSEIALATIIKKHMSKPEEARALMEQFYKTSADIKVDNQNKIIQIKLHHQATRHEDMILRQLCEYLNETETIFPGTDFMLQYCQV